MNNNPTVPSVFENAIQDGISWTAPSIPHHDRSPRWYMIGAGIVGLTVIVSLFTKNWSLTLLVLLIGGAYYMLRDAGAILHSIVLQKDGFLFDGVYTPWKDCRDFWVINTPLYAELHIWRKHGHPHEVTIQMGQIDTNKIVAYISPSLTYKADRSEHLFDFFIRICKL
jgi:hypothetical protein